MSTINPRWSLLATYIQSHSCSSLFDDTHDTEKDDNTHPVTLDADAVRISELCDKRVTLRVGASVTLHSTPL